MKSKTKADIQARIAKLSTKPLCFLRVLRLRRLLTWLSAFGVIVLMLAGCKFLCNIVTPVAESFATTVIDKCVCSNPEQVQKDILGVVNSALVCDASQGMEAPQGGPVWNTVCSISGQLLTGFIAGKIPADWGCSNSLGCVGNITALAVMACDAIPVPLAPKK
jgi:hypothetical protein